jgi:hypothetical protein
LRKFLIFALFASPALFAADPLAQIYDNQVNSVERDILRLAQAMPADKYNFAPTNGAFTGVRTFGMQVRHIATYLYMLSSAMLAEKPPVDIGSTDNGPDALQTKDQILEYFKGSIAYAHKGVATLTATNQLEPVNLPGNERPRPRVAAASMMGWHSFDHYGQMVVYARMNGVVPGQPAPVSASR